MDVSTVNSVPVQATANGHRLEPDDRPAVILPDPDPDNITVLTHELPNDPILPWNHFDSPWLSEETSSSDPSESNPETAPGDRLSASESSSSPVANANPDPTLLAETAVESVPAVPDTLPDTLG